MTALRTEAAEWFARGSIACIDGDDATAKECARRAHEMLEQIRHDATAVERAVAKAGLPLAAFTERRTA